MTAVLGDLGVLAGRILFGQLVLVGLVVLVLRLFIRESTEWRAARQAEGEDPERVRLDRIPQLFRAPLRQDDRWALALLRAGAWVRTPSPPLAP